MPTGADPEAEKLRIIRTAAELIKTDIKSIATHQQYPEITELRDVRIQVNFIPHSLKSLLKPLVYGKNSDLKVASIGQATLQAARPRVIIAPMQIGLGVQLHHHYGSRFLIDTLNHHGFCISYSEVRLYERSAAVSPDFDIPGYQQHQIVQYVADNVDDRCCHIWLR